MALLLTDSTSTLKSGLVPLDKLDDKNFSTWKFQAWLTIQTLELENHLDPSKAPSPTDSSVSENEAESGVQNPPTARAAPTLPPTAGIKTDKGNAFRLWHKHDLALQTWLVIIDGSTEEYHGFTASIMARFGTFTVPEVESFLKAYDEMLNRSKNLGHPTLVANLTKLIHSIPIHQEVEADVEEVLVAFNVVEGILGNKIEHSVRSMAEEGMLH
ncbi:hypothetical protein PIB30_043294 [Stylosanthes scabra]|uniref:Retrotransposon Copia-like N-terminal domain-containing protein n=1 Tax=Stylosanthes scabra TaxID=79078 RepID=A0ABU6YEA6_9FABA|nr:hypothetical protein [Stylosanthes scabra]